LANFISLFFPSVSYSDIGIKGIHVNKNVAGFASIMGGAILAFAMPQLRSNAAKFIGIAIIILALVFLVLTKSKTNLFVLLVLVGMMPLYVLLVRRREAKRVHFIATCVVCGLFFLLGASGSKLAALGALYGDPTLTNRAVIWLEVEAFIAQSPWRGVGFGSFWDIGQEWNLFPVRYYVFYNDPLVVNLSHNGYVDILLHGGRIALVLAYIATAQIFCYTLAMATGHGVPRHHKWAFCMLHCLIIMIMVQNLTESSIFFPSSSASYFFLILLAHGVRWKAEFDTHKERVSRWARHTTQLNAPIR
jgi:O-antigen ligase